jgi:solute carrier family 29 (equilibrative nucleoside transporter), member 1/2/3
MEPNDLEPLRVDSITPYDSSETEFTLPIELKAQLDEKAAYLRFSLFFLNGAVLWAYYSCLSAQNYFSLKYPTVNFAFLTTLCTAWPMFAGQLVQLIFGLEKKFSMTSRMLAGYTLFMICALLITIQDVVPSSSAGSSVVLACIGVIGFSNSITESIAYAIASILNDPTFSNSVQSGNAFAGVINVALSTVIRFLG